MYKYGFLKVAAASPVARVGDPFFNVNEMLKVTEQIKEKQPAIVCFPELCISGYSIGDLVFQDYLYNQTKEAIDYFLKNNTYEGVVIFGSYLIINDAIYNCCFVTQKDKILGIVPKNFLPNTNEFYEARWFASGVDISIDISEVNFLGQTIPFGKLIFTSGEVSFGVEVCADMWAPISPNENLLVNGAILVFNLSASPANIGKSSSRRMLIKNISYKFDGAYIYVSNNASESSSEVVFSGHKLICESGQVIVEENEISLDTQIIYGDIDIKKLHFARRNNSYFKSVQELARDLMIQTIPFTLNESKEFIFEKEMDPLPFVPKKQEELQEIIDIQAAAVIKRLQYVGTDKVVIGVSGGLDSTLALLSLAYAFTKYKMDRHNIIAYTLPSKVTSSKTYQNSLDLMKKLGVTAKEVNIYDDVMRQLKTIGHDGKTNDVTYENVQARFRTYTLMNSANFHKGLVIGTSDMSELALGWATFNGDHMAMYGLNAGLPKTVVREVVRYYQFIYPELKDTLNDIIATPISPELTGLDQLTEDIIGKYEINDFILYHFLVNGDDSERIIYLLERFLHLKHEDAKNYVYNFNKRFYQQQYKRLTSPEAPKILKISLSPRTEIRLNGDIYRVDK